MGEVQKWLSVRIQRHLGFEAPEDAAPIVSSIMDHKDPKDIENSLVEMLGSDDAAQEIISAYFKKIAVPRPVTQQKPVSNVYAAAAESEARSIPREGVFEPRKKEEDDLGYGVLVKKKKKGGNSSKKENYQRVGLGASGRTPQGGNLVIMKKVRKGARGESGTSESVPEFRERSICGCQARLHPFVNNCLKCGRIVCLQEDIGPCFFCGHFVTPQGTPQMAPFTRGVSSLTPTSTPTGETEGNPDEETEEAVAARSRATAGLQRAQDNLARLLQFDASNAERTTVYDDQADYFDMSNRWISADERAKLAKREAELLKSKAESTNTLVLDFAGRAVVASVQTKDQTHARFQEEMIAKMKSDQMHQKLMDREEAEEQQRMELERVKGHLKHRPDGSIFVIPDMDVPAPEFVFRAKEEKENAQRKAKGHSPAATQSPSSNSSPSISLTSSSSIPNPTHSRLQTDFFPEVEIEVETPLSGLVIENNAGASIQARGIVEGFSGRIWTNDDRMDMIEWMNREGNGNFYMWAPYDDPMHRRLWNYLFSDVEVANLKSTISKCNAMGIEFNLAIRPHAIDFRSILHTDALARKILQAYEQCGCRSFSIIFADEDKSVPNGCRSLSSAQSDLVNTLIQVVDEFVKLKSEPASGANNTNNADQSGKASDATSTASKDTNSDAPKIRWLLCPTMYTSHLEPGQQISVTNYLRELNRQLDSRVELLWSGPDAPAATMTKEYMDRCKLFFGQKRNLFFWDRVPQCSPPSELPTNSSESLEYYARTQSFMDVYDNRSPLLGNYFKGALVSTLAAPLPSRITLGTALQFFRDTSNYDPKKALGPAIQKYITKDDGHAQALKAILSIIPTSRMTNTTRAPSCVNRGDQEERGFWTGLRTNLNKLDKGFPDREQFDGALNLVRDMVNMNFAWFDYVKDPRTNASALTQTIRVVRASLVPVLYTEHELAQYRAVLFNHAVPDKSLKGDVQRTFTKFKTANTITPKDSETKEMVIRLATECTLSLRELEAYLIQEYTKDDFVALRTYFNLLFFRDASKPFLHKMPVLTSPPAHSPNVRILELRSARIKAKLAEEERHRAVALKFALASQMPEEDSDDDEDDVSATQKASSSGNSSVAASSAAASSSASAAGASTKKLYPTEVKDLPVAGLRYIRNFLTPEAEAALIASIDEMSWDADLTRKIQQYGFSFDYRPGKENYNTPRLEIATPLPQFLKDLADEITNGKYAPIKPDQAIINEYTPGQGIRHHIDNVLAFEDNIISISLGTAAVMEFANKSTQEQVAWLLEPRSLLIMTKEARTDWSHSIPLRTEDIWNGQTIPRGRRISVTLRKVKHAAAKALFDAKTKKK